MNAAGFGFFCRDLGRNYDDISKATRLVDVFLLDKGDLGCADEFTAPQRGGTVLADYRRTNFVGR